MMKKEGREGMKKNDCRKIFDRKNVDNKNWDSEYLSVHSVWCIEEKIYLQRKGY